MERYIPHIICVWTSLRPSGFLDGMNDDTDHDNMIDRPLARITAPTKMCRYLQSEGKRPASVSLT